MILATTTQVDHVEAFMGDNFGIIVTAIILVTILIGYTYDKYRVAKAKHGEEGVGIEAIKEVIISMFSEERFQVLAEQCINDSLEALVKGTSKEQFVEDIKDNLCDALYNFVETEYPRYTVICSRNNIEKLADVILDWANYDDEKIGTMYQEQVDKLNNKDSEE